MTRLLVLLLIGIAGLPCSHALNAHELRPAYLELRQTAEHMFRVYWKVPARGDRRLALYVNLPEACISREASRSQTKDAIVERWQANCPGGIFGRDVSIDGLNTTLTDVLVRLVRLDGSTQIARLTPEKPGFTMSDAPNALNVAGTYFFLGVEHILFGIDHLLFVFALLLIVSGWQRLLATITAFTIAHSITLGAATFGLVWLPAPPVEAVIALSIMFLASEMVRASRGRSTLTARFPWVVAFAFGLLHGLGFASALAEVGLPQTDIPLALLMFNVGVEVGQILFVAMSLAATWCVTRWRFAWPGWTRSAPAYAIGTISAFWLVERISGFWQ